MHDVGPEVGQPRDSRDAKPNCSVAPSAPGRRSPSLVAGTTLLVARPDGPEQAATCGASAIPERVRGWSFEFIVGCCAYCPGIGALRRGRTPGHGLPGSGYCPAVKGRGPHWPPIGPGMFVHSVLQDCSS